MTPLFIMSLFITGYLLFQENNDVHQLFSLYIVKDIVLENNLEEFGFSYTNNIFWDKELINMVESEDVIDIRIARYTNIVYEFSLEPGRSHSLDKLEENSGYKAEVCGNDGRYFLNFV